MLLIQAFSLGPLEVNNFVLHDPETKKAAWIDCGEEPWEVFAFIEEHDLDLGGLFLTHAHADHIAGLNAARAQYPGLPVWLHRSEEAFLFDPGLNLSSWLGTPVITAPPSGFLDEGGTIDLAGHRFEIWHTPGHSPGSVSFYSKQEALLISGDVLFRGSVGRSDFPTSDPRLLEESLARLMRLDDEVRVFSGHGQSTTIGRERRSNPFLR